MHGHDAGEQYLVQVAHSIMNTCTCVSSTDIPCRYGGEEFAIIVYGGETETAKLAEAIRKKIYTVDMPHPAIEKVPATLSIGFSTITPNSETEARTLIECADANLCLI